MDDQHADRHGRDQHVAPAAVEVLAVGVVAGGEERPDRGDGREAQARADEGRGHDERPDDRRQHADELQQRAPVVDAVAAPRPVVVEPGVPRPAGRRPAVEVPPQPRPRQQRPDRQHDPPRPAVQADGDGRDERPAEALGPRERHQAAQQGEDRELPPLVRPECQSAEQGEGQLGQLAGRVQEQHRLGEGEDEREGGVGHALPARDSPRDAGRGERDRQARQPRPDEPADRRRDGVERGDERPAPDVGEHPRPPPGEPRHQVVDRPVGLQKAVRRQGDPQREGGEDRGRDQDRGEGRRRPIIDRAGVNRRNRRSIRHRSACTNGGLPSSPSSSRTVYVLTANPGCVGISPSLSRNGQPCHGQ